MDELKDLAEEKSQQNLLELSDTKRDELFGSLKEFASKRRAKQIKEILEELDNFKLNAEDTVMIVTIKELFNKRKYIEIIKQIDEL